MARPTKYATPICIGLTILAALGIVIGLVAEEPLVPILFMAPAVGYEVYRTEGASTRWASWALAALIVGLIVVRLLEIDFDLRELIGTDISHLGGREIPLGDIKVVFPAAMAALAGLLWTRTRGIYTRWLAAIIFVTSAFVVYLTAPEWLGSLVDSLG